MAQTHSFSWVFFLPSSGLMDNYELSQPSCCSSKVWVQKVNFLPFPCCSWLSIYINQCLHHHTWILSAGPRSCLSPLISLGRFGCFICLQLIRALHKHHYSGPCCPHEKALYALFQLSCPTDVAWMCDVDLCEMPTCHYSCAVLVNNWLRSQVSHLLKMKLGVYLSSRPAV